MKLPSFLADFLLKDSVADRHPAWILTTVEGQVTSGVGEEGQGGRPGYACCTFRGSVTALDANTRRAQLHREAVKALVCEYRAQFARQRAVGQW